MKNNIFNRVLNYSLNKFCPMVIIGVLVFLNFGFYTWEPYVIAGLLCFSQNFHYKVGYSVAICEERGLLDEEN
jgi:hypothetical protein